jgi:hypothetical protein
MLTPVDDAALADCVREVQSLPYTWPAPADAAWTRTNGAGTCAGKHALLAEELAAIGFYSRPLLMVGPLVPALWSDLLTDGEDLLEVHECLTVETAWAGPLLVDVTWHPAAVRHGLGGSLDWDGRQDMAPAWLPIASYAVSRSGLRVQKEALRSRLYTPEQRARRDGTLAEMARRASTLMDEPRQG